MREPRKRPCLLCKEPERADVHNVRGTRHAIFEGRPVATVGRDVFYVHAYDPGERRVVDRGIAYRGRGA